MATSHYKIKTKDLKAPDEFVTLVDRIGNYLADNLARVIVAATVVIALVAVAFTYAFYRSHQQQVVADRFYDALTALNHREFQSAAEDFDGLAESGSGPLASLARLYAASAYMSNNKPGKARDALEAYLAAGDQMYFRNLALVQLGVAYEDLGDFKKARDAYTQAATTPGPEESRAELGVSRTLLEQGDKAGAVAAYRNFLNANPFAPERAEVTQTLATLDASPTASGPAAATPVTHTIQIPGPTPGAPAAPSH